MINMIDKEQVEALVRWVDSEFEEYFKNNEHNISSFKYCFLEVGNNYELDESEFKLLPRYIRHDITRKSYGWPY